MKYVSGLGLESLFFVLIIMVFGDSETAFDVCQGISRGESETQYIHQNT